jgi:hypothetical protein
MGRVRRGGYVFEWWIGDHPPRHVHVFTGAGKLLARVAVEGFRELDDRPVPRKVLDIIEQLKHEGRL